MTRSPAKKPAAKKPAAKKPAASARVTPNGLPLRGSAGPRILKDLGLTDAELAAFLPADAPRWVRSVLWCQFVGPASLEAIAAHFAERFEVSRTVDKHFPPDGPSDGIDVPMVTLRSKGNYVAYSFYRMSGESYVDDGTWQLEAAFRESGRDWGSNRAVYERFKALELPGLGAREIVECTDE